MRTTRTQSLMAAALVGALALATTGSQAEDINTPSGKLEFENGYPSKATVEKLYDERDYQRANGFKTYIVTGGGQEFVRVYSRGVYGIPPEQVVGSSILTKYEYQDDKPVLMREPKVFFIDDHTGKAGGGARLMMLVYHDDAEREYAYGPAGGLPDTKVGTFSQALMDEAQKGGWVGVSMKNDWKRIFGFEK